MPYVADVTGRGPSTATLAARGLVALAVLVVVVAALLMQYKGVFRSVFPATALVTDVGDGITVGADVKLRGALIGSVGDVRVRPGSADGSDGAPQHEVDLLLRPDMATGIPSGVTARVVPTNVFGAPSVELVDPADAAARPKLASGAVIPGDRSAGTLQLQTVMNQLNRVLRAVEPAKLNVALTNLSQALQGRGDRIGSIVGRLDRYLTTLNAHTGDFSADISLLGTDLDALAGTAPDLLETVDNAVVTTRTLVDERDKLTETLTGGTRTADGVDELLDRSGGRLIRVVHDAAGITGTLAPQRELIPRSLASLGVGTQKLGVGFSQGQGGLSLVIGLTPFSPYTAKDCPRYPGLAGPNCGDRVPAPGTPPSSFPYYQGPPAPPTVPGLGTLPAPPAPPGADRGAGYPREQPRPDRSDPSARTGPPGPPGPKDLVPGMFGEFHPSAWDAAAPGPGGSVGPVGGTDEARTVDALLGGPASGSAGLLLLGPIVRGSTVVLPS
ncbi:MAG TPA: MCE family protein [Pseudonocardia sp.]|jgi:virulence factor Mce-like protein